MNKIKISALALTAAVAALTGCQSTNQGSSLSGTHEMGSPKSHNYMSNKDMPPHARGTATQSTKGQHEMGSPKSHNYMSNEDMPRTR